MVKYQSQCMVKGQIPELNTKKEIWGIKKSPESKI